MTVLREPLSRILPLWMYWRSSSDEEASLFGAWRRVIRLTRHRWRALAVYLLNLRPILRAYVGLLLRSVPRCQSITLIFPCMP